MKIGIRNIYVILIATIMSVMGTLASRGSDSFSVLSVPYLYTIITIFLIIRFYKNPFVIPINKPFLSLIGACTISAVLNNDEKMVISCICMFFIFSYLIKASDELRVSLLIGTAMAQFVFLFRYGLTDSWNGNSVLTALAFVTIISLLSYLTNISDVILLIITFAAGVIVIVMSSRTSIIAFFVSMICLFVIRYKKTTSWPVKLILLFVLLSCVVFRFREQLTGVLFNKWADRGYTGVNALTGRGEIWINELKHDWTFWGNGELYFDSTYHHNDAHNIFIQVLGRYGTITLIVFMIFIISLAFFACKMKNDSKMYVIPIAVAYIITGFFENVLFLDCKMYIPSIIILIIAATIICYKNSSKEDINANDLEDSINDRINTE